jgi:hypothetical protein
MSDFDRATNLNEQTSPAAGPSTAPRAWWADPQMLVAVAALCTSVVAVGLGAYGAYLQRQHDRAEVWPHLEVGLWEMPQGAAIQLTNTGIGPARVESVVVTVNGKAMLAWDSVVVATVGKVIPNHNQETVVDRALRPGDKATLLAIGATDLPSNWHERFAEINITVCYTSVFGDGWSVSTPRLGGQSKWTDGAHCVKSPVSDF